MYSYRNLGYEEIGVTFSQTLQSDGHSEGSATIYGFQRDKFRSVLYHVVSVLCLGIPYVICSWFPQYKTFKYQSRDLRHAQIVLVSDINGTNIILPIQSMDIRSVELPQMKSIRYFYYQHTKYVLSPNNEEIFVPLDHLLKLPSVGELVEYSSGVLAHDHQDLLNLHGPNAIVIEVKSYWNLFKTEVFSPYNVLQLFAIVLWTFDNYIVYAACILVLTLFSIFTTLRRTRKQSEHLRDMVESSNSDSARILRPLIVCNHTEFEVKSSELVPGDLLVLPSQGCILPCDALLLTGSCIVNESMLTGESIPVTKTPPVSSNEIYDSSAHKRHTLYAGTNLIQAHLQGDKFVLARVLKTGFNTTKGSLIKSILYPTPVGIKFYRDSMKFISILSVIAFVEMLYAIYIYIIRRASLGDITLRVLDIITIVVPPALPAAMNIGIGYSQDRLKNLKIFCVSPNRINLCGTIKLACFDKTGTLTEDCLEFNSIELCNETTHFWTQISDVTTLDVKGYFLQGMAVCHSLTKIDNQLIGDPLDINLFENTQWELEVLNNEKARASTIVRPSELGHNFEIHILRTFAFSSNRQCMSVICSRVSYNSAKQLFYTKGAPEKIHSLCQEETIPSDFHERLMELTGKGFRVIALAYKQVDINEDALLSIKREAIERDLIFLGFISMQNPLKPETIPTISSLKDANIRPVMITGDNIGTAVAIAQECGIIPNGSRVVLVNCIYESREDTIPSIMYSNIYGANMDFDKSDIVINIEDHNVQFAMDGKTWSNLREYYPDIISKLLVKGSVFARFQPDQKTQVIKHFQSLDYIVSMVGDGANDCGALKAAHVGISLSQAVAGVAAPFTSSEPNISCIKNLILEGRCALVTSFAVFKYMTLYSLIQFISVLILYRSFSNLGDIQFLFIDMIMTTTLAVTMGRQGPSKKLTRTAPLSSLVSLRNVIPLMMQIGLCGGFQIVALYYLTQQHWFKPVVSKNNEFVILCWENTVVFTISSFQYIVMALAYSPGKPFRESRFKNGWFIFISIALFCFSTLMLLDPPIVLARFFAIVPSSLPQHRYFRYKLMVLPAIHAMLSMIVEVCVVNTRWLKRLVHCLTWKVEPKNRYNQILKETNYRELIT